MDTDTKSALTRNKILGEYAYQKDLTWKIKVKQLSYIRMHRTGCDSFWKFCHSEFWPTFKINIARHTLK